MNTNTASIEISEKKLVRAKTAKPMLWLGIVSIVMVFAGFTSAYVVRAGQGDWTYFELPIQFLYSTATILLSSFTLFFGYKSAKKNQLTNVKIGVLLTLLLGCLFVFFQFQAWNTLVTQGVFLGGKDSNASGSFLYVISGMHLLHLAAGLIVLIVTGINALQEKYNTEHLLGLQLTSIYWHFLSGLWLYLLLFLYFIH